MAQGQATEQRTRWHVGIGRVELEPEPLRFAVLRANIRDPLSRALLALSGVAQLADVVMTAVMIRSGGWYERNAVVAGIATNPTIAAAIKVGAVAAVCILALARLPRRRARVALAPAAVLSTMGPLINLVQFLGSR